MPGAYKKYKAAHPCNQFLVEKFMALKRSADVQKLQNQSACYRKIIFSLDRYPLPIICVQQALALEGVGTKMANLIKTLIHQRYSAYLNDSKHNQFHNVVSQEEQMITDSASQMVQVQSQSFQLEKLHNFSQESQLKHHQPSADSKSNTTNRTFRLKKETSAYYFLMVFDGNTDIVFSKKVIKTQVQEKYGHNINHWTFISKLQTNEYIEVLKEGYKLLPKGGSAVAQLQKQTKAKSQAYQTLLRQLETRHIQVFQEQKLQKLVIDKSELGDFKLYLVIDNREVKSEEFKQFFNDKLVQKSNIPCLYHNLTLGDFLWILQTEKYGQLVLDYIIQRKINSDLASSILDGRYKEQRFRLSNCGIQNVYYIYEGKTSANLLVSERAIDKALRSIQFKSNFKVIRTTDIRHTTRYLNSMHTFISKTIESSSQIVAISTLTKFNAKNSKSNIPVNCAFGLMLKCIPMVGRQTVELLTSKFKSMRDLYLCLKELPADERVAFVKALIQKKNKSSQSVANTIIKILFQ